MWIIKFNIVSKSLNHKIQKFQQQKKLKNSTKYMYTNILSISMIILILIYIYLKSPVGRKRYR